MTDKITIERETLLPCPFCGHVGLDFAEGSTFRWIVASCAGCGATTGETRIQTFGQGSRPEWMAEAQQDAIKQWNRRAALAAQPAPAAVPLTDADTYDLWDRLGNDPHIDSAQRLRYARAVLAAGDKP